MPRRKAAHSTPSPSAPRSTTQRGRDAEDRALLFLQNQGLTLVARNVRGGGGELDLVMQQGEWLVFVEVRSRRCSDHGSAAATVSAAKQRRLLQAAAHFLQTWPSPLPPCRFDVMAFDQHEISWICHAFEAE